MSPPTKSFFQYDLELEIPATEVAVLIDALDGETLSLRDRIGKDKLRRELEEQEIDVHLRADERWTDFQRDIQTISTYLAEPISGRELHFEITAKGPAAEGWTILAWRGASERLALDVDWDTSENAFVDRGIDRDAARRRWNELPDWVHRSLADRRIGSNVYE
jgi:hypothetical protein